MFNFMDRYKLWNCAVFKDDGGNGGGDDGGSDDKPAKKTVGSVSKTGQYAGDGFEWVENDGGYLTRTYTGANKDAGLGTDVRTGGTEDKAVKEAIATISLNEGSQFAGSQASVTDYDALDIFRSQDNQKASSSFAEQAGVSNYEPSIVYGDDDDTPTPQAMEKQSFGDAFADARKAGQDTFTYEGNLYTTDLAPDPAPTPTSTVSYDAFGNEYTSQAAAAEADNLAAQQAAAANEIVRGTEEDLFEQPVMTQASQNYLDSLGTDFDFGQFDTPSIDYTVSQGEAGRGGDDTAAPGFTYELPGVVDTSAKDADLGVGASKVGVTADDLATNNFEKVPLDGGGNLIVSPETFYGPLMDGAEDYVASRGILEQATDAFYDDGDEYNRGLSEAASNMLSGGMDLELERLLQIKNTAPETLTAGEYLRATDYEREKYGSVSAPSGTEVASPITATDVSPDLTFTNPRIGYESGQDVMQELPSYLQGTMGGVSDAFYGGTGAQVIPAVAINEAAAQAPSGSDILKSLAIGIPGEMSAMTEGLQSYAQARPNQYTGNLMLDAMQEVMLRLDPEKTQQAILSQTPEQAAQRGQGMGAASEFLGDVSTAIEDYFYPDRKRDLAVVTGTTPSELEIQDVQGEGGGAGLANVVAEETGGALGTDIPLAYMGVPGRLASGVLNFGEQLAGVEPTTRQALDVLEAEGVLQNNPVFKDALEKQGGNVEAAKDAIVRANVFQSGPAVGGTGALDAVVPGPGKGLLGIGKNIVTRGAVEGVQEPTESVLALSSLNNLLQLPEEQKINVFQDATGNAVMGTLTGTSTSVLASPLSALSSTPNQAITNKMNADAAAAQAGQFVPTSPTAGQVAQAPVGVESSYDQEAQGAVSEATTMERVAAQEIIDNVKAEEGTVSPQILQNLQNATGLSMQELSDMASDSVVSLGNFSVDPTVGSPIASDLRDQPTGIGGGSNIAVEPLPSGDTLLRNNDTGRTTVVNQGEDLAAAIQTFDEVTTPFVDTRNPLQLTADMQVGAEDTGSRINFQPTAADQAPMMPTTTRDTDVDLSGIASRLNLTGAESLGPTTPDLSGIASRLNLSLPETPAIPADPATPSSPLATIDTTMSVGDTVNGLSVSDTLGASTDPQAAQLSLEVRGQDNRPFYDLNSGSRAPIDEAEYGKPGFRIISNGDGTMSVQVGARIEDPTTGVGRDNYTSASMILPDTATQEQQRAAINEVANTWKQNYEGITSSDQITQGEAKVQPMNVDAITTKMDSDADIAAEVEVDETPVFTSVRADQETTETPVFSTVRDTDTTEDTIVELDETPVFTSVRGDTTVDTDEGVTVELEDDSDAQGELDLVQVEDRKTTIPSVTSTKTDTTTATDEATDTATDEATDTDTTTEVKVLTETGDYPDKDDEEVDDDTTTTTDDDDDTTDIVTTTTTTTDDDGNTITECPEGFKLVQTEDGPMCVKTVKQVTTRQRAGRNLSPYTRVVTRPGEGLPQRRKTSTVSSTQRVRPTTRNA